MVLVKNGITATKKSIIKPMIVLSFQVDFLISRSDASRTRPTLADTIGNKIEAGRKSSSRDFSIGTCHGHHGRRKGQVRPVKHTIRTPLICGKIRMEGG